MAPDVLADSFLPSFGRQEDVGPIGEMIESHSLENVFSFMELARRGVAACHVPEDVVPPAEIRGLRSRVPNDHDVGIAPRRPRWLAASRRRMLRPVP